MSGLNFNTANQTFRQLMGTGLIYNVPRFQRDYSWTEEEWDDLWNDIKGLNGIDNESVHYMGYLVLQSPDSKKFDIIDGQQRMATISLIILSVLKNLNDLILNNVDPVNNKLRLDQLRSSFIGYLDPVTLVSQSKLNLNRNNNVLFQRYLIPLDNLPQRNLKATEHLMRKSFEWFYSKIKDEKSISTNGAELAKLVEKIVDKLFFTVITVTDELNAFKVFETLNARGVRLSSTDLLKNYLFSVVFGMAGDDAEMSALEERWDLLVNKLGSESMPEFLRTFWNSRNKFVRHSELFKTIREQIRNREGVFSLLRDMETDAEIYSAFSNSEDSLWTNEQKRHIAEIKMFNVKQLQTLLLSGHRVLQTEEFTSLLRACSIISFRYNVISNYASNEQERVYNSVAQKIAKGELTNFANIIRELRTIYPNDEKFKAAFADKQIKTNQARNKKLIRYILFNIEKHISTANYDMDSEVYNIEHIMPINPGAEWGELQPNDTQQYVYRIGNMTILTANDNREVGNSSYQEKTIKYGDSDFSITKRIAEEYNVWDYDKISSRQRWMANQAASIWRINQLA